MENRPQWGTRAGFILAAVGSAVGLGNIWRFPGVAYENGGGAFFLPYLFALLTAGIPLLIMEFTIGHKYRGSSPLSFARLKKGSEWLGWWQLAISFVISTYYAVIIAWAMSYAYFSLSKQWGDDPLTFLVGDYLQVVDAGKVGSLVPGVFVPLIIVWVITLGILFKGVKKGIEAANKVFIPALVILFLIIVVRALTLEGAVDGINAFFKPDWGQILNGKVWVAAYGQIFFSLSIAFAIMITYSSYLPKKSDITNNAFITGFANSSFEVLAGIGVFAALGFMANQQGVAVDEVVSKGVILAFAVFPQIINELPAFSAAFGVLFFVSLTLAGLTSLISIVETYVAGIQDKFKVSRNKAVAIGGGISALISILFATQGGLNFLDTVDAFINNYGVVAAGFVEIILVAWVAKELNNLRSHADAISDIQLGSWWNICLKYVTPVVLGVMMVMNILTDLKTSYGGYPESFNFYYGWLVALGALLVGFVFKYVKKWDNTLYEVPQDKGVSK
ncbi:sodium-dependent transporter [Mesobacillus subterraneus]|uniref:sodium-dependent transporter n=1 Tax=Mesobacillus subterraneus TaxID=285983 RepID=UPI0020407733|nr:sodium-dependent transporter [Mesobacillus subterraneus]MCM3663339.1 sodium-dependent transporter [Mesobacillus subterraneus]MCM3683112.1 sodium-dependent transporter [Mesobacillus subterraneus]